MVKVKLNDDKPKDIQVQKANIRVAPIAVKTEEQWDAERKEEIGLLKKKKRKLEEDFQNNIIKYQKGDITRDDINYHEDMYKIELTKLQNAMKEMNVSITPEKPVSKNKNPKQKKQTARKQPSNPKKRKQPIPNPQNLNENNEVSSNDDANSNSTNEMDANKKGKYCKRGTRWHKKTEKCLAFPEGWNEYENEHPKRERCPDGQRRFQGSCFQHDDEISKGFIIPLNEFRKVRHFLPQNAYLPERAIHPDNRFRVDDYAEKLKKTNFMKPFKRYDKKNRKIRELTDSEKIQMNEFITRNKNRPAHADEDKQGIEYRKRNRHIFEENRKNRRKTRMNRPTTNNTKKSRSRQRNSNRFYFDDNIMDDGKDDENLDYDHIFDSSREWDLSDDGNDDENLDYDHIFDSSREWDLSDDGKDYNKNTKFVRNTGKIDDDINNDSGNNTNSIPKNDVINDTNNYVEDYEDYMNLSDELDKLPTPLATSSLPVNDPIVNPVASSPKASSPKESSPKASSFPVASSPASIKNKKTQKKEKKKAAVQPPVLRPRSPVGMQTRARKKASENSKKK
jgi:hypothetical protein